MVLAVVGLGLIGGSMATDLRKRGFVTRVLGVDRDPLHADAAKRLGIVDEICELPDAVKQADLIISATPVSASATLIPQILDLVENQVVTDVGSTKTQVMKAVADHPRRSRFVGSHPMAGTEHSGPWAALSNLFDGKAAIICDADDSAPEAVDLVTRMYDALNMRVVQLNAATHDLHVAYVSHISHVSSFALALTVLEKEKDEATIFDLASGGFSSTARLAKSASAMWTPIFTQNSENILNVLDDYIEKVQQFRDAIAEKDEQKLSKLMSDANRIRRVLS
ncbi:MAG: prephenate dehydrogenase [Lentisphaeria bacterium]|nr:prephenate dehydrogenase [Lentisphaeria bacterium]